MLSPEENVSETPLLDLNNSTARTLVKTIGVTPTLARKIVSYRRQKGWYDHIGELWRIKQMTLPLFEAITSKYTVHRQYAKQPSRRLQVVLERLENKRKSPDRDSDLSGGRRIDPSPSSVSRNPNKLSIKTEGETQNITDKTQRITSVSKDIPLPQIRMDPIAVNRSVSGNVVMVTYKAADRDAKQGAAEADHIFDKVNSRNRATQIDLSQSEPDRNSTTTPGGPLTAQKLKIVENSNEKRSRVKSIEKWISDVNEAEDGNEKKKESNQKMDTEKTKANGSKALSVNPEPGLTGVKDRNQPEPQEDDLGKYVESQRGNTKSGNMDKETQKMDITSEKMEQKSEKMDKRSEKKDKRSEKMDEKSEKMEHKSERNRAEDQVPGTSGVKRDIPSTKKNDKAVPVNEITRSKRKAEEAEQRHHRHKRHHSDRRDRYNEDRTPRLDVVEHRHRHRHDKHRRKSNESAEKSKSVCQIM